MQTVGDLFSKFILPLSGAAIGWLAVLMSRRGANRAKIEQTRADEVREDQIKAAVEAERRAEITQRMETMQTVIDRLVAENQRLTNEATAARESRDAADARADQEIERVRGDWEARWHRQMERCRHITEPLVAAIARLSSTSTDQAARAAARQATNRLEDHDLEDHGGE